MERPATGATADWLGRGLIFTVLSGPLSKRQITLRRCRARYACLRRARRFSSIHPQISPVSGWRVSCPLRITLARPLLKVTPPWIATARPNRHAGVHGRCPRKIDRDRPRRQRQARPWESYEPVTNGVAPAGSPDGHSVITRAEESNTKGKINRREFYEQGIIARVEEDTDGDGRIDKWELIGAASWRASIST